jgi:hypothetical protein
MKHLSEEHLILHYYGETDASEHLEHCEACRAELRNLAATLDSFHAYQVPERQAGYEALLWQRIAPQVRHQKPAWWKQPLILGPIFAGLVVASFFAGRISNRRPAPVLISSEGRQRILQAALGDHLERSQVLLVEIANSNPGDAADFQVSRDRAQDLVFENRLYSQTARQAGNTEFTGLLEELDRVLTDIANGPSDLSTTELERVRGLIFKIRVVGTNLQQEGSKQL